MYQVLRVQKLKSTAIGACQAHNLREYKTLAHNIDEQRTKNNVELLKCSDFSQAVNQRVSEIQAQQKRKIRKDCPRALEYVVSASSEFFKNASVKQQKQYFEQSLEYLKKRHGENNVISAVIHNDEQTPHMHVVVVPEFERKLNPKHFMDKFELPKLHSEFNQVVGSKFELERGEQSDRKHMTAAEHERALKYSCKELEKRKNLLLEDLEKYKARDFEVPILQTPDPKLLESKADYGKRCMKSACEQITPSFKVAQSRYNASVKLKKENENLKNELEQLRVTSENQRRATLNAHKEALDTLRILTPLTELIQPLKRKYEISTKDVIENLSLIIRTKLKITDQDIQSARDNSQSQNEHKPRVGRDPHRGFER